MKIIATSDWHGYLPELPKCDLLLHVGDICPDYHDERKLRQQRWFHQQFIPHVKTIAPEVIGVFGNHDWWGQEQGEVEHGEPGFRLRMLQDSGTITHLDDGLPPLYIWGMPWVSNLPMWAFNLTEKQMAERVALIPASTDILLSHAPPRDQGDKLTSHEHVGWKVLQDWLQGRDLLVLCGHIHEAAGEYGNVYNVAYVDEFYDARDRWLELTYDKDGLRVDRWREARR